MDIAARPDLAHLRNESTSLLAGFPAKTSAPPVCVPVWTGLDPASGSSISESFASFGPESWLSRTSEDCLFGVSIPFSGDWPTQGMTRNGRCYAQAMLARRTDASACLLSPTGQNWPPATVSDTMGTLEFNPRKDSKPETNHATNLAQKVQWTERKDWTTPSGMNPNGGDTLSQGMAARFGVKGGGFMDHVASTLIWPTPVVTDVNSAGGRVETAQKDGHTTHPGMSLTDAVRQWPTPRAEDSESSGERIGRGTADTLTSAVREKDWRTPQATEGRANLTRQDGHGHQEWLTTQVIAGLADRANPSTTGNPIERSPRPVLNPRWVATLMGFPPDYLDGVEPPSRRSGTPSFRKSRRLSHGA